MRFLLVLLNVKAERKLIKNPDMPITVAAKDYLLMLINGRAEKKVDKMFNVKEGYHDDQY